MIRLLVLLVLSSTTIFSQNIRVDKYIFASSAKSAKSQNTTFYSSVGQFAAGKFKYNNSFVYSGFWVINSVISDISDDFGWLHYRKRFIISPNPPSEYIEISLDRWSPPSRWTPSEIKIYNTLGECVLTTPSLHATPLKEGNIRVDISHLPIGLYFIQIEDYTQKFVVVR